MKQQYNQIPEDKLKNAFHNAWSIENIESHEDNGEALEYIGSDIRGNRVYDYYLDNSGKYWYQTRAILPSGEIVSMEQFIFGKKITKNRRRRRNYETAKEADTGTEKAYDKCRTELENMECGP